MWMYYATKNFKIKNRKILKNMKASVGNEYYNHHSIILYK